MSDLRDDERLRSLLRRIDPAQAASDAGPPAFLRALRDRLAAEQAAARSRERRRASRRFGWTLAVASLVVVATVSVSVALVVSVPRPSAPFRCRSPLRRRCRRWSLRRRML